MRLATPKPATTVSPWLARSLVITAADTGPISCVAMAGMPMCRMRRADAQNRSKIAVVLINPLRKT